MKITLLQLNSSDDISKNLERIVALVESHLAAQTQNPTQKKTRLFILPENSLYFRIIEGEPLKALTLDSAEIQQLQRLADLHKIDLHFTTAISDGGKVWNASVLVSPGEPAKIIYKKIHLFDIQLEGQKAIRESDFFTHGDEVTGFEIDGVRFGSSICYDLRFSELYQQLAKNKVDVILVPAAFLVKTGQAHWETLLRARAIESQAYVLASAQVGEHKTTQAGKAASRFTYGHTMAIDPWGQVVEIKAEGVGCLDIEISLDLVRSVRRQIPMSEHRRLK
ncbi:carbon-nitrogen hydrolase family protein [Bdellovibrio sp. qaytius]|nr:carbon-nitrogen hydrolase family protein [Bdellovibrio sp. qaytius]